MKENGAERQILRLRNLELQQKSGTERIKVTNQ